MVAYKEDVYRANGMNKISTLSLNFKRVLVVDNESIMGAGLEKLLSREPLVEVVGINTEDEMSLVQNISRLLPDIIILILESQSVTPIRLLELLNDLGNLRIVLLSTDSNFCEVYDKKKMSTTSWMALLGQH